MAGILVSDKVNEIDSWLKSADLGNQINYKFQGQARSNDEVNQFMIVAGITAIFVMLLMLLTQFNSFYQSAVVLSSVVMSFVGVLLGLLITNKPFKTNYDRYFDSHDGWHCSQ